jgi:UDP-glucose 4-epimerase
VFSRDEKKQDDLRHELQVKYPNESEKVKFYIGDVRSLESVRGAMYGVDYIFHAAALKQVPSCEFFPMEAVRTNIIGTDNVLTAAIEAGVKAVICLSTDKAAYPINAMGISKALMEKNVIARSRQLLPGDTVLCLTRYGNVMASRGSVIPLFLNQISEGKPITITNPDMTRFMMTLDDAVDLVLYAFEHGEQGDLFVQKAPAATIDTLAKAVIELTGSKTGISYIGTRHGEKLYETLVTQEEMLKAVDLGNFFCVKADNRDLNYDKYFSKGNKKLNLGESYTSHNTGRLDVEGMKKLLKKLELFGGPVKQHE